MNITDLIGGTFQKLQDKSNARKIILTIDAGTQLLIDRLTLEATRRLRKYLIQQRRDIANDNLISISFIFRTEDLEDWDPQTPVKGHITFDREKDGVGKLIATVNIGDTLVWRRGSLRAINVIVPATMRVGLKGHKIEEVVAGTPFGEFVITSAVIDHNRNGSNLRIRSNAETHAKIRTGRPPDSQS